MKKYLHVLAAIAIMFVLLAQAYMAAGFGYSTVSVSAGTILLLIALWRVIKTSDRH